MPDAKPDKSAGRKERLAAQLRENLKKRKVQSRARRDVAASGEADTETPAGLAPPEPLG